MDQNVIQSAGQNPLSKHFRQPTIYFKLPSQGSFWPNNALSLPATGEIGVMPMTTKDEITLRTPDALLNGQGVVNVIESCCPSIHDAWAMPSIDVDATLIAIRIASYGNQMDFTSACPFCNESHDYAIDLGRTLSTIQAPNYNEKVKIKNLTFKFKPQAYFEFNKSNMISFEEQQILRALATIQDDPVEGKAQFDLHLSKVIELNINILATSTEFIETEDNTVVTDRDYILDFYSNADTILIKAVQEHLNANSKAAGLPPITVTCLNENCAKEFPVNITFEYSSFFGKGS